MGSGGLKRKFNEREIETGSNRLEPTQGSEVASCLLSIKLETE